MGRARRVCGVPGCPEFESEKGRCSAHQIPSNGWNVESAGSTLRPAGRTALRARILRRDRYVCRSCGGRAKEVDHILPAAWGGGHADTNLCARCVTCHRKKTKEERTIGRKYHGHPPQDVISAHLRIWA